MINVLHGRHVGVVPVARRSSRLVPPPWVAAQPRALVQLVQLLHALGDGPSSHALAEHGRPASPRRARPTRRVPLRSQAVWLSLHWCATRDSARVRVRARRVASVAHAETARVRPGAEPHRRRLPCSDHLARARARALALLSKVSRWVLLEKKEETLDRRGVIIADTLAVQGVEVDSLREERGDLGQGEGGDNSGHVGCPGCRGGFS